MVLQLQDIDPETDFPAIARCEFEAHENPPQRFFHAFFPILGAGNAEAREDAIAECAARLKLWHAHDPTSTWKKVVDTETGQIAAASLWNIYRENPFAGPPAPLEVDWFPDDGSRAFAQQFIPAHSAPRARVGQRPHVYLFMLFTHPDYRRRGAGQLCMDWGKGQADTLGLEMFLESTPYGRPLYEKNGFVLIEEYVNHPQTNTPDEAWKAIEQKVGPVIFRLMWRPAGCDYEEAKTIKPWEEK
ncbi:hypothetical protein B0T22DRAFT_405620 [Podospora appendiculata]|uniref:N-acetyltransferase domain-containing protein n=1 Tax=Podospora appendiculata TaxID=314037 RepID=A0AAE0X841_9PEZI|nr:hypothetical protein B0T22DRAFT_405620 [Podospora appendiculata]